MLSGEKRMLIGHFTELILGIIIIILDLSVLLGRTE